MLGDLFFFIILLIGCALGLLGCILIGTGFYKRINFYKVTGIILLIIGLTFTGWYYWYYFLYLQNIENKATTYLGDLISSYC